MLLVLAFGKAGFAECSAASELADALVDQIDADIIRYKETAVPADHFAMLRVAWL